MHKRFVTLSFFLLVLAFGRVVDAREWVWSDSDIIFQIPDDPAWKPVHPPVPEVKLLLQRSDKGADIFFKIDPAPANAKVLDQFVPGFEKGCWPPGQSVKRSGKFFNFKGKQAYETTGELYVGKTTFESAIIVWMENDEVFEISVMKREADPSEDSVIKAFLASIKFGRSSQK